MKKVLIEASTLEQNQFSGVNYFADGLARALEKAGGSQLETHYLWMNFLGKSSPSNSLVIKAGRSGKLHQFRLIPQRLYAKLVYAGIAPPLLAPKVDWVIFPNFYLWPLTRKTKSAVIIHDVGFLRYPEYIEDKNRKFLDKVALRSIHDADLIISNSQFTTDEIQKTCQVPEERIVTVNIPVDSSLFAPETDRGKEHLKDRYGIHKPYILSLGTLEPRKNIDAVVDAYCRLPKEKRDKYSLVLAGKWGWKIESTRQRIEALQADNFDIITTGYIDMEDRSSFYFHASYYILGTFYEGFGMPLLEALYCGLPTVASDIPVLREVGDDACLWASPTAEELSSALDRLIDNESLASQLRQKGMRRARQFSWDETGAKLFERLSQ